MQRPDRLSAAFVRNIKTPGRYGDGRGGYGLSLLVKPNTAGGCSKSFAQRLRFRSRAFNIGLGPYPLVTLAKAREIAIDNARLVRDGVDPRAERRLQKGTPTFQEAADIVIAIHAETWKSTKTPKVWRSRLATYAMPRLANRLVSDVTSADVLGILTPIWAEKRETAMRVRQYVSAVMKWAVVEGYRDGDPAGNAIDGALPRGGVIVRHQRALPFAEVGDALATIRTSDAYETTKLAIEFLTLTATRSGEVREATWEEIDIDRTVWTIPASRMKTQREHRVPLTAQALTVLNAAQEFDDGSGLVFPSVRGKAMTDSTMSKLFRVLAIDGTPHGMRSSFRDWAAEKSDAPREIAEMCLAHVEGSAAELAYRRTDYFERRRELMQDWADFAVD